MKCQQCEKPATFHITELTGPQPQELHLCESCAKTYLLQNEGGPPAVAPTLANVLAKQLKLGQAAEELANRMIGIFTRDASGRRPVYGERVKFQEDPHWRDLILFHEYFHAETGEGLGASHQTGWTGLVATLIDEWRR